MATEKELREAKRLVLSTDKMRRDVTKHLRWALDTLDRFKDRMPKDQDLARACAAAHAAARTSERLSDCAPE